VHVGWAFVTERAGDPAFASAWLKWGQAVVHAQALNLEVKVFCVAAEEAPLLAHRTEYHPRRHGFAVVVDRVLVPIPVRWGLILGDFANNLRSSLDHLAWALVVRGRSPPDTLTPKQQGNIKFPIMDKRSEYNGELPSRLPGVVGPRDKALVRASQPYLWGARARHLHPLSVLRTVNNADKHRTIQPIWDFSDAESAYYEVTEFRDCVVSERGHYVASGQLKADAEVAFIRVRKTGPEPSIEVRPCAEAEPVLDGSVPLEYWLENVTTWIALLLREFADPAPEVTELGIDPDRLAVAVGRLPDSAHDTPSGPSTP
jgi:hypothetical protein